MRFPSKKFFLCNLLFFLTFFSLAQNGGTRNNWYFGSHAGLNFNNLNNPSPIVGVINSTEGCASISSSNGSLLFSTNGVQIYGSNNQLMPNGNNLSGHVSSTQSATIVPNPANTNQYYLFTVGEYADTLTYSMVDMSLNSGNGGIVNGMKNIPIVIDTFTERVTAIRHCNKVDYWLLCHPWESDAYYAYLITAAGIQAPIITHIGHFYQVNGIQNIGMLKVSPDGKKVATSIFDTLTANIEVFDFNNVTGVLSNIQTITTGGYPYGLSFSPDSKKLYATISPINSNGNILRQYDVTAANIQSSGISIYNDPNLIFGSLQLAPNGKIYMAIMGKNFLSVINSPNLSGPSCALTVYGVFLLPTSYSASGLPNFIDDLPDLSVDIGPDTSICAGNFTLDAGSGWATYSWSTNATTQSINTTQPGLYWVEVSNYCGVTARDSIVISHMNIGLGNDTVICANNTFTLDAGSGASSYLWSNNATSQTITANSSGIYWVQMQTSCGLLTDTMTLTLPLPNALNLGNDTYFCHASMTLDAGLDWLSYTWSTGDNTQTTSVNQAGTYWVETTNACATYRDSIVLMPYNYNLDLGNDVRPCSFPITLDAGSGATTYLWSNNATSQTISVNNAGVYSITTTDNCGDVYHDTIVVIALSPTSLNLGNDFFLCSQTASLDAGNGWLSYLWSDGSTNQLLSVQNIGTYWVETSNGCTTFRDTVVIAAPTYHLDLGNDSIVCTYPISLQAQSGGLSYVWSDGSNSNTLSATQAGTYWVNVFDGCVTQSDTIQLLPFSPTILAIPDQVYCGESFVIDAGSAWQSYLWSNNTQSQTTLISSPGVYSIQTQNTCFTYQDSFVVIEYPHTFYLGKDTLRCGKSITLSAGSAWDTYLWSNQMQTAQVIVKDTGTYWVEVTNICGTFRDSIHVAPFPLALDLGPDIRTCHYTVSLDAGAGWDSYIWTGKGNTLKIEVSESGFYEVIVQKDDCELTDKIRVDIDLLAPIDLGENKGICVTNQETILLDAGNYTSYFWQPSLATTQTIIAANTGIYNVSALDTAGCEAKGEIHIEDSCSPAVFFPTAFTPNNDGINDAFFIKMKDAIFLEMHIYDRWGILIFSTQDINYQWNGTFQGQPCPEGAYICKLYYETVYASETLTESITLLR